MTTMAAHRDLDSIDSVSAWRAVEQRDGRYDGQFVYGVASTHIYCKPGCPSRRPSRFKSRLRAGATVSRATYDAGFGSSSRVYEKSDAALGMTPAAFRRGGAGVRISYTIADAPIGRVLVATTERGVCAVEIGTTTAGVERTLKGDFPNAIIERDDDAHGTWVRAVLDRVRGMGAAASHRIPLDVNGTAFQMKVWAALQQIPVGERRSYREVAESIGQPSASRAVARACATNRAAVVIPCHRVGRESGDLAGYKWGIETKRGVFSGEKSRASTWAESKP